jgi:hypothetical protein
VGHVVRPQVMSGVSASAASTVSSFAREVTSTVDSLFLRM